MKVKIALVHDYLKEYGGGERVLEAMHEIWPQAPVYTAFVDFDGLGPHAERIKKWDIRTSWVDKVWPIKKLHSPLRFLTPLIWESFNFDEYEVVISSSAWYIPRGIITRPETEHISYVHTPPRHLYGYRTSMNWRKYWPIRIYGEIVNHFLRIYDYLASQRVDYFIANSKETKKRIKKFYRRQAEVIYPPVKTQNSKLKTQNSRQKLTHSPRHKLRKWAGMGGQVKLKTEEYFLYVGRLARAKHVDLALKACDELGLSLKIVGKGREEKKLKTQNSKLKTQNIQFLGEVSDEELKKVYQGAGAFIFPAEDEEFGIAPVEAMACGLPVIAYKSGGVKETVIEGKTGVFFKELTVSSLKKAIKQLDNLAIKSEDCIEQAEKFSKERFKKEMKGFVNKVMSDKG